jgi:hypothetical protein
MPLRRRAPRTLTALAASAALACTAASARAQDSIPPIEGTDVVALTAGGALGATVGFFGGALLGARVENSFFPCGCDDPGLAGAILGAAAAMALTIPLGVHAFDAGRGDLSKAMLASLAGGFLLTTVALSADVGEVILAVPVAEIVGAVVAELKSRRR